MAIKILQYHIEGLHWRYLKIGWTGLEGIEKIAEEASFRGEKVLSDILAVFPKAQLVMAKPDNDFMDGAYRFYAAGDATVSVYMGCMILPEFDRYSISDLDLIITHPSEQVCRDFQKQIDELLKSYCPDDVDPIYGPHTFSSQII